MGVNGRLARLEAGVDADKGRQFVAMLRALLAECQAAIDAGDTLTGLQVEDLNTVLNLTSHHEAGRPGAVLARYVRGLLARGTDDAELGS